MKQRLIPAVLAAGLFATVGPTAAVNAAPPTDAGDSDTIAGVCSFLEPVEYTLTGKTKTITRPDGQRIITSPGQRITLTANRKTVTYVITGTRFERDVVVDGQQITEIRVEGRNLLVNGPGAERRGIFLVVGNFNYALDANFNEVKGRGFNVNGPGQVTDVCAALT